MGINPDYNADMNTPLALLNGLTPTAFLAEYWQKKPLLIRNAIPNFKGLLSPEELAGLACEEAVESRIIQYQDKIWRTENGPFDEADFTQLPDKDWTLLVQSVNQHLPEAAELLQHFNFIPYARLDDLMVSYAPTGGSVGAHMDSYDVFLLQGSGTRRWQISAQTDLTLIEDAPIKLLKQFDAEQEWVLAPGDMLYLPPSMAHHGISESDDCMTYSIGFRAPNALELMHGFAEYLQDTNKTPTLYTDPNLKTQKHPAEISQAMIENVSSMLRNIDWTASDVGAFLGSFLSEPKPHVFFDAPAPISMQDFIMRCTTNALTLDLKSQLLFTGQQFYLNGEPLPVPESLIDVITVLADTRILEAGETDNTKYQALAECLYPAYQAGYIHFVDEQY